MSTGQARPLKWRKVFKVVHGLSHPSVRATKQLLTTKFVWNGMQRDVGNWAKQCIACQSSKIQTHIKATLNKITVSKDSFNHIHVELVGLPSKGYTICSPSWSFLLMAIPLIDTSAASCAQALIFYWNWSTIWHVIWQRSSIYIAPVDMQPFYAY